MKQQSKLASQSHNTDLGHLFVPACEIREYIHGIIDVIARRAYEIFENRGAVHGHDWEDWFRAESEVLGPITTELEDSGDAFLAVAAVDDYRPEDLRISAAPRCLWIWGLSAADGRRSDASRDEAQYSQAFFVSLNLPAEINTSAISADIRNGILEVRLPKALSKAAA